MHCNSESDPTRLPNIEIGHQAGGSDPSIPYIISPRLTFLLNTKHVIRWNEVLGVKDYLVRITKDSEVIWEERVNGTEIVYSGEHPLEPGAAYVPTVEADNSTSSGSDETPLAFQIISENIAEEVREVVEDIDNADLTVEEKAIRKARLFNSLNLKDEAIKTLEQLLVEHQFSQECQQATIFLTLGKLYGSVGLNLLAEDRYSKAQALSASAENSQVLAEATAGLAGVKLLLALGKINQAIDLSSQARDTYTQLGDEASAQRLEGRLVELANRVVDLANRVEANTAAQLVRSLAFINPVAARFPPCQPWQQCARD